MPRVGKSRDTENMRLVWAMAESKGYRRSQWQEHPHQPSQEWNDSDGWVACSGSWSPVSSFSLPVAVAHPCWLPTGSVVRWDSIVFHRCSFGKDSVQSIFHSDENDTRKHLLYLGRWWWYFLSFLFGHRDLRNFETLSCHRRVKQFCLLVEMVS